MHIDGRAGRDVQHPLGQNHAVGSHNEKVRRKGGKIVLLSLVTAQGEGLTHLKAECQGKLLHR